jgi:hypothetical protein
MGFREEMARRRGLSIVRAAVVTGTCLAAVLFLGCNALLDNEARSLGTGPSGSDAAADAGAESDGPRVTVDAPLDASTQDALVDASAEADAGPICPGAAECPRFVFVTSAQKTGDLGDVTGADALCQSLASASQNAVLANRTFAAWIGTPTSLASARLTQGKAAYKRVDEVLVANTWADLTDGTLANPIDRDEKGAQVGGSVWTGTNTNGTASNDVCSNWKSTAGNGQQGVMTATSGQWTDNSYHPCNEMARVYCFER